MGANFTRGQGNNSSSPNSDKDDEQEEPHERQRVILLAGPHKTSSSSIQLSMLKWLNDEENSFGTGLSQNWAWPSPTSTFKNDGCDIRNELEESKIFYSWIQALKGQTKKARCLNDEKVNVDGTLKHKKAVYTREEMIDKYRNEFGEWWRKGYSLVIASEAMDYIASERYHNPQELLENILHQLPWYVKSEDDDNTTSSSEIPGSDDDITVVVSYRSPRSSHLISIWHQCCMKDMSLYEFLTHRRLESVPDPLKSLDSLKLVKTFLDRGLRVVLVDMAGVRAKQYDISSVIACDVLGAKCTKDKHFLGSEDETPPQIKNVKTHSDAIFNVTEDQLEQIDAVIRRYDCNFLSLMDHENFQILYAHGVKEIFDQCKTYGKGQRVTNRQDMVGHIISIAKNKP